MMKKCLYHGCGEPVFSNDQCKIHLLMFSPRNVKSQKKYSEWRKNLKAKMKDLEKAKSVLLSNIRDSLSESNLFSVASPTNKKSISLINKEINKLRGKAYYPNTKEGK